MNETNNGLEQSGGERQLIVTADDFGMLHGANEAIGDLMTGRFITSTSLMIPCPWALDAVRIAARHPNIDFDFGVHLTFTSGVYYNWGPVHRAGSTNSLVNEYGRFPADSRQVERADPDQIRAEIAAQLEWALARGIDVTHVDDHLCSLLGLYTGRHFMDIVFDLCAAFGLPFRFPKVLQDEQRAMMAQIDPAEIVRMAENKGVALPDRMIILPYYPQQMEQVGYEHTKRAVIDTLRQLRPGVTELICHPAADTAETKAVLDTWQLRRYEWDVFRDEEVQDVIRSEGIRLIKWRDLRDRQRGV
ncbi:hypothetical protein GCM10020370_05030 [Paenibacillus hodogayensis]